ncbi:MAG TPA: peptidylprolyl isomerase [Acidimicrobiales bacterium]|jgi:hypothetical protein
MRRLVGLFVVVAVGIAVAALTVPSTAASVNGTHISQSTLNNDLGAVDASPGYLCYLQATVLLDSGGQSTLPPLTTTNGTASTGRAQGIYNAAFVRYWLSRLVSTQVVSDTVRGRGITVSAIQLATARSETEQIIEGAFATLQEDGVQPSCSPVPTGAQVLGSLPGSFVDDLVRAQASSDLLAASEVGSDLTQASMDRYFAAHPDDFETLCVNGFSVGSQASAAQIRSAVEGGTPFAQAAPSGTTVQNACFTPSSSNYQAIDQAVGSLAIGGVSQPLESSQSSYYLFELTSRTPSSLASVRNVLRGAIVDAGLPRADALLTAAERKASVNVDPRYGTWRSVKGAVGVVAPTSPPTFALLDPAAVGATGGSSSTGSGGSATGSG